MLKFWPADVGKAHQILFVVVARSGNHGIGILKSNAPHQVGQKFRRHFAVVDHAHGVAHLTVHESAAHPVEHGTADVVVVHVEFCVPRYFKRVGLNALRRKEKVRVLQVVAQHVVQKHQVVLAVLGQFDKASVDFGRNLDQRQHRVSAQFGPKANREVNRCVVQLRKGQVVLQNHGKHGGTHLLDVKLANEVFLTLRKVLLVNDFNALGLELPHQGVVHTLYAIVQDVDFGLNGDKQVRWIPAAKGLLDLFFIGRRLHALNARISDPKKLVEVVREDSQKANSLN